MMVPLPKEHGAYGQIAFPLIAAFAVAGTSTAGVLCAAAVVAGFLAHEPGLVLLGQRGPRAKRELGHSARWWFACWVLVGIVAGIGAMLAMAPSVRWSISVPLLPAAVLAISAARGQEKSWYGETAAALAFSGAAVPVSMAAGLSLSSAAAIAVTFALLFVSSTLAVRVVILRVRRGGDHRAMSITRSVAVSLAIGAGGILGLLSIAGLAPVFVLVAAVPGLLAAAGVAVCPPAPTRLRALGWTLVLISVLTTAIVVSALWMA
jgi:hypothetical protein